MRARLRNKYDDKYSMTVQLPKTPLELYDILDRLGADNKYCNVYMNIEDDSIPGTMQEGGFYDDIFKLNLLAQRLDELHPADKAGFTAVLYDHDDYSLDDLILVTYGLDAYPIYPCGSYAELGETVIDNDMIEEAANCPDELVEYLDKEAIGRLAAERFKGTFVNGYYCEVSDYEQPDMEITIVRPARNEFLALIGTSEKLAQWYVLPYIGSLNGKEIYSLRSPLPDVKRTDDIRKLNELAEKTAQLERDDIVKLKAIMESSCLRGTEGALYALDVLDDYELDSSIRCSADFGKEYLRQQLPEGFDMSILDNDFLNTAGSRILDRKGAAITAYGLLSGAEQELYSSLSIHDNAGSEEEGMSMV